MKMRKMRKSESEIPINLSEFLSQNIAIFYLGVVYTQDVTWLKKF